MILVSPLFNPHFAGILPEPLDEITFGSVIETTDVELHDPSFIVKEYVPAVRFVIISVGVVSVCDPFVDALAHK